MCRSSLPQYRGSTGGILDLGFLDYFSSFELWEACSMFYREVEHQVWCCCGEENPALGKRVKHPPLHQLGSVWVAPPIRDSYSPPSESRPETNGRAPKSYFSATSPFFTRMIFDSGSCKRHPPYRAFKRPLFSKPFAGRHAARRKRRARSKPRWTQEYQVWFEEKAFIGAHRF